MTTKWWVRATLMTAVVFAGACAGKSAEPARPAASPEPSPAASPQASAPRGGSPEASAGGGGAANEKPTPVGNQLIKDVNESQKQFKLVKNDGSGHALGNASLTVDGRNVWPPEGPGCAELVKCCNGIVEADESLALACLLAAGRDPDCPTALRTSVAIAGESNVPTPPACPR